MGEKRHRTPQLDEALDEVLEFMRDLWAVHHALEARSKRMATSLGVTGPQRLVIVMIGRRPGVSAGELAELLHVHPSTVTGMLRRLEQHGLIARKAAASDRRRAELTLTSAGKAIDATKKGTVQAAVKRALERAAPADVAATRGLLGQLTRALEEEPAE